MKVSTKPEQDHKAAGHRDEIVSKPTIVQPKWATPRGAFFDVLLGLNLHAKWSGSAR